MSDKLKTAPEVQAAAAAIETEQAKQPVGALQKGSEDRGQRTEDRPEFKPVAGCPRIYTRCPACHNDTLIINKSGRLLCRWQDCKDPTLIDRLSEVWKI